MSRALPGLWEVSECSRTSTVWGDTGRIRSLSLTPFCVSHAGILTFPPYPYPICRVIIRGGKAAASQDLMGQLGVISKVEHSTSAVEVQLPKLGEGEGEKGGGKGTTGIGCSSKFTCGSGMQA